MNSISADHLLENAFAEVRLAPGQRYYRRMSRAAWTPAGIARRRAGMAGGIIALLMAAFLAFTPPGRAWAQIVVRSLLGYFDVTEKDSLPLPATPRPVPTYMIEPALVPFRLQPTPAVDPAQCGTTLSLLTSSPLCQMLNVQEEAGFDIKVFGGSDLPLRVNTVFFLSNLVGITYYSEDGTQSFHLAQGVGDYPPNSSTWGLVQSNAVQQVVVGTHPAELVVGQFVNYIGKPSIEWSNQMPQVQLRWKEGDHWYSIEANRYYWTGEKVQTDELTRAVLTLGQNLVPLSDGPAKMDGEVDQTPEQRIGFQILTPKALPAGSQLVAARFATRMEVPQGAIVITYEIVKNGQSVAFLTLYEASNPAVNFSNFFIGDYYNMRYKLIEDDLVRVGNSSGRYMVRESDRYTPESDSTALVWERYGVKLMLWTSYDAAFFGGRFTKAELIAIAESIK